MTWNQGTATDYIDLLDQLVEVATSRHLATVAINNDGSGYTAGDILGITGTGATATHVAQIEVVSVDGSGQITAARVYQGGAYTVDPSTTTGNAATGGTGASATFNLTFAATGWTQQRRTKVAASATIDAGGSGYSVGNVLTLVGGVLGYGGSAATFTVATESGGAVTSVTLTTAGQYEVTPGTNAVLVSGGGGTGCALDPAYTDKTGDTVVVLTGDSGGSAADPVLAIKTYQGLDESGINTTYNWALFSASANSQVVPVHELSNVTAGFNTSTLDGQLTGSGTGDGAFFPCKTSDAFTISWWFSITGRRIHVVAKVEGASTTYYPSFSVGLLNPFGITSELAYPAYVVAPSDRSKVWYRDTNSVFGGIGEVLERNNGPGFFWAPEGAWIEFKNALLGSNTDLSPDYDVSNDAPRATLWPLGYVQLHETTADQNWSVASATGFDNADFTDVTPTLIYRTPNAAGDLFPLFPLTVIQGDSASDYYRVLGEIDGCFWFSTGGTAVASEDRITQGSTRYRVFQNGTRVEHHSFVAIAED
jgi:hypothetical protein